MNAREAMAALQAAPKFGNQVELLNIIEASMDSHDCLYRQTLRYIFGEYDGWQQVLTEKLTPPWPKPEHTDAMMLVHRSEAVELRAALRELTFRDSSGEYRGRYREDADLTDIVGRHLETLK